MVEDTEPERIEAEIPLDEREMTVYDQFLTTLRESLDEKCKDLKIETLDVSEREGNDWTLRVKGPKDQVNLFLSNLWISYHKLDDIHTKLEAEVGEENIEYTFD